MVLSLKDTIDTQEKLWVDMDQSKRPIYRCLHDDIYVSLLTGMGRGCVKTHLLNLESPRGEQMIC
jgi:hypothetical protein